MATSAVVFFLFSFSGSNLPTLTALSVYQDQASCTAAVTTMTPALGADQNGVKLGCVSSADLVTFATAAGVGG